MGKTLAIVLFVVACGGDETRCDDPRYGDGTCDLETSCGAPDIDCFATFDSPAAARAWYETVPARAEKGASLPDTDARFAAMQALLDDGWAGYRASHEVGDLEDKRVQLVLVDATAKNAFVSPAPDRMHAGLVVMVNKGLIDANAPKEQLLGVVMHELEHAVGLHVIPEVKARTRKFYVAPAGSEPLGFEQIDEPVTRAHMEEWLGYGEFAGYVSDAEIAGLPHKGFLGDTFIALVNARSKAAPSACAASIPVLQQLLAKVDAGTTLLDGNVTLATTEPTEIANVITKLRNECFAGVTGNAIAAVAAQLNVSEAKVRTAIPADILAKIETQTVITGLYNWAFDLRAKMRDVEARYVAATGTPWSRVRWFTTEEAADDSSVATLHAMGLPADGIGKILPTLQDGLEPICRPLVDGDRPIPYGEDLVDDHHALCWRAGHAKAMARVSAGMYERPALGPLPLRGAIRE